MSILDNIDKPDPPNASKAKRLPPIGSDRAAIIEECARVAESFIGTLIITGPQDIAAAIRALKDK